MGVYAEEEKEVMELLCDECVQTKKKKFDCCNSGKKYLALYMFLSTISYFVFLLLCYFQKKKIYYKGLQFR